MGVTYKLNDEIVHFITLQKRDHPDISCRSLVARIDEKFSLKVSKSTINAVLKEANLSSPIGRPAQKRSSSRKFAIPVEKKIQPLTQKTDILESKAGSDKPPESLLVNPIKQEDAGLPISLPKFNFAKSIEKKREFETYESVGSVGRLSKPNQECHVGLNADCMGESFVEIKLKYFLMLLVIRDFFSLSILDVFFKRNTSFSQRDIDILDVLMCFYPEIFEAPEIALKEENAIFWKILGWKNIPGIQEIESIIQYLKDTDVAIFDFYLEAEYFLTMITSIHLIMKDGKILALDGRMRFVVSQDENLYACPIERALFETTRFLSGKEILRLHCPKQFFSQVLLEQMANLCVETSYIQRIVLNGLNNQIVSQIDQISTKVKGYVVNINMTPKECEDLFRVDISAIGEKLSFKNTEIFFSGRNLKINEIFLQSTSKLITRIAVFHKIGAELVKVVLTNLSEEEYSNVVMFDEFLEDFRNSELTIFKERDLFLTVNEWIDQKKLSILLSKLLEIMLRIFTNGFLWKKFKNMSFENNGDIAIKCDKNSARINVAGEEELSQLVRVLSLLFPMSYNRIIINKS